jgi:hypothetical protein
MKKLVDPPLIENAACKIDSNYQFGWICPEKPELASKIV